MDTFDVIVVGKGNAALCAAIAATEKGARVAMLESASKEESGGNTKFAGGVLRFTYSGIDDLRKLTDLSDEEANGCDWDSNTVDQFTDDMFRVTNFRTDPELCETLVSKSYETMLWLRALGVGFIPNFRSASIKVAGRRKFFGGQPLELNGGGHQLVRTLTAVAESRGVKIYYNTRGLNLVVEDNRVVGIDTKSEGKQKQFRSKSIVLACGGFSASPELRARYLGPGWDLAKVRGTRHNVGDGLRMALDIGAMSHGNWSGCHACSWERYAPNFGNLEIHESMFRHSFPLSIMINSHGKRFVDEGADFYSFTYAKYGSAVMAQPNHIAWQVFDAKTKHLLRPSYSMRHVTKITADSLEELASKFEDVDPAGFLKTVREYNAAVKKDVDFDPTKKDGKSTEGVEPKKSNWANVLDTPPFEAYAVTGGITFTFGGLKVVPQTGQVIDKDLQPIEGLYAAGELVGGLFYHNYPAGAGIVSSSVFGKMSGAAAGQASK